MYQGVFMSVRQEVSFWVLEDFQNGKMSRRDAALTLGISQRSVSRKAKRLRDAGLKGLTRLKISLMGLIGLRLRIVRGQNPKD